MNRSDLLRSTLTAFSQNKLPTLDVLDALLSDQEAREQLLAHPPLAAALAEHAARISGLSCANVESNLAAFLDAEREQRTLSSLDQRIALHIRGCPSCYDVYALSLSIIAAQTTKALPQWPTRRAAAAPSDRSALTPIVLRRNYIQRALHSWQQPMALRGSEEDNQQLLYAGSVPDQPDLLIQIFLRRPRHEADDAWELCALLQGSAPIDNRRIELRYSAETWAARTDADGQACFTEVPAAWILSESAPDLQVCIDPESP